MKRKTILIASPNPEDATSFYRGLGPWTAMRKGVIDPEGTLVDPCDRYEFKFGAQESSSYSWAGIKQCDLLFFQRPTVMIHLKIIDNAKTCGLPVWVDFDDDLLDIPKDNPVHAMYTHPEVRYAVTECIKRADLVSVSTEALKRKLSRINPNIVVIPNALDDTYLKRKKLLPMAERPKTIVWRGSSTHQGDLFEFREPILEIAKEFPELTWAFIGHDPWFITERIESPRVIPPKTVPDYFDAVKAIQSPFMIVPLKDNSFNRSKSNIAWLEGTWAGSTVLTPDWEEWNVPGYRYTNPPSFYESLRAMLKSSPEDREETLRMNWELVQEKFLLSRINYKRLECLDKLLHT